jgi:hypothetical protein
MESNSAIHPIERDPAADPDMVRKDNAFCFQSVGLCGAAGGRAGPYALTLDVRKKAWSFLKKRIKKLLRIALALSREA